MLHFFTFAGMFLVNSATVMAAGQDVIYYSDYDFLAKEETWGMYNSNSASSGISQGFQGSIETESRAAKATGWFTQNGHRYYRMPNGNLYTVTLKMHIKSD